jgi:hypothetical protein
MTYKEVESAISLSKAIPVLDRTAYEMIQRLDEAYSGLQWVSFSEELKEELFTEIKSKIASFLIMAVLKGKKDATANS